MALTSRSAGPISDGLELGLAALNLAVSTAVGIYYPLFHAWDDKGRPFADQLMLVGLVGVNIPLGAARE